MEASLLMRSKVLFTVIILPFLFAGLVVGCLPEKESKEDITKKEVSTKKEDQGEKEKEEEKKQSTQETMVITLYFADDQAMYLVPEKREVPKSSNVAKVAVQELIKGPKEDGHYPTLPQEAKVLSVNTKDGSASVNFSEDFEAQYPQGSTGETLAIYSIVNTLTEFSSIDKVRFLAEGHLLDVPDSNFDLSRPFSRDEGKIKSQ